MRLKTGRVQLYAGDGKGKSTAACGLAVRAAGRGFQVRFCQFLKGGNSGELRILETLPNVEVRSGQSIVKFTFQMDEAEREVTRRELTERLEKAFQDVEHVDVLILDEILGSVTTGMVDEDRLIALIQNRPSTLEVVMTGRGPSEKLIGVADYYSEICARKHPYQSEELEARAGIEF